MELFLSIILVLLVILIVIGTTQKRFSYPTFFAAKRSGTVEHFSLSSLDQQLIGASSLYNWGLDGNDDNRHQDTHHAVCKTPTNGNLAWGNSSIATAPRTRLNSHGSSTTVGSTTSTQGGSSSMGNGVTTGSVSTQQCSQCDIMQHPDIQYYVLKSSVPPSEDMSKYVLKSEITADKVNMSDYVKKSEIPACEKCPDMSQYVLKSEVPSKPNCPVCPTCPVCPVCPKTYLKIEEDPRFSTAIAHLDITQHPSFSQYIKKEDARKILDKALTKQAEVLMNRIECPTLDTSALDEATDKVKNLEEELAKAKEISKKHVQKQKETDRKVNQEIKKEMKKQERDEREVQEEKGTYDMKTMFGNMMGSDMRPVEQKQDVTRMPSEGGLFDSLIQKFYKPSEEAPKRPNMNIPREQTVPEEKREEAPDTTKAQGVPAIPEIKETKQMNATPSTPTMMSRPSVYVTGTVDAPRSVDPTIWKGMSPYTASTCSVSQA